MFFLIKTDCEIFGLWAKYKASAQFLHRENIFIKSNEQNELLSHQNFTILFSHSLLSSLFNRENAVLGESFTSPLPNKGDQTFVLCETNFVMHRKQNK
jgi:hypothetical protein